MAVYMSRPFSRFARKNGISDPDLCAAAGEVAAGRVDADLGGGVLKQRVARAGAGKSGGFRVIILFKAGSHLVFVHGFAKSKRANISRSELASFRKAAVLVLGFATQQLETAKSTGALIEVKCNAEEAVAASKH